MDEKEIQRLIKKLKENYKGNRMDAVKDIYDAAIRGKDISAASELLISTGLEKDDIDVVVEMLKYMPEYHNNTPKALRSGGYPSRYNSFFGFDDSPVKRGTGELRSARIKILEMFRDYLENKGLPSIIESFAYPKLRDTAIDALNKFMQEGTDVSSAVPTLITCLNDKSMDVRKKILETLGRIGDERAIPTLVDILKSGHSRVQWNAAEALKEIAEKIADKGNYSSALNAIKESTIAILELYPGKDRHTLNKRKEWLGPFAKLTEKIHDKMNTEKKKFPVKRQEVRSQEPVKKPLKALYMK